MPRRSPPRRRRRPSATPVFRGRASTSSTSRHRARRQGRPRRRTSRAEDFVVREDGRPPGARDLRAGGAGPRSARSWPSTSACSSTPARACARTCKLSQESAIRFLDAIPRARDLLLIFFDRDIRISRYNSENQQGIFGRILETKGEGYTALYDAIAVYLSRVADTPGRKVLVLFTDGDDTTSQVAAPGGAAAASARATRHDLPGRLRGRAPAEQRGRRCGPAPSSHSLAELSGGRVFQPTRLARAGRRSTSRSSTSWAAQYVLGYVSDNPAHDGKFRRITVEVKRPALKVRHRPGYDAPKDEPPQAGPKKK